MPFRWLGLTIEGALVLALLAGLAWSGVVVREKTWQLCEPIRYVPDMDNGWEWGSRSARDGYVGLYDQVVATRKRGDYGLDYMPLRLGVMTLWAKSQFTAAEQIGQPPPRKWNRAYEFNRPLLRFNMACEAVSAAGLFVMVWDWTRRDRGRSLLGEQRPFYGVWPATFAFALAWFNPASLLSAHGRPTWDVWLLPFYVWAVVAAGRNFWLTAGGILGVGTMFKGQELFAVPLFLLWPMFRLDLAAMGRFIIGLAFSVSLLASPWLVGPKTGTVLFVGAITLLPLLTFGLLKRWPIRSRSIPRPSLAWLMPLFLVMAIWACVPLFGGSINWLRVGLIYGSDKFRQLEVGGGVSLAGLLQNVYRWRADSPVESLQWLFKGVTISQVMAGSYGLCVVAIAWAAARYAKRGDRRFVLAMAAVWIVYFALFPKMHERYLIWGGVLSAAAVTVSSGMTALGFLFSIVAMTMTLNQMSWFSPKGEFLREFSPEIAPKLWKILGGTQPGLAWAILLATVIWLWQTVAGACFSKETRNSTEPVPLP